MLSVLRPVFEVVKADVYPVNFKPQAKTEKEICPHGWTFGKDFSSKQGCMDCEEEFHKKFVICRTLTERSVN
jgi:hypothetical protein